MTALLHCPNHFYKMSHFKVTEVLRRQVVQMKSGRLSLSAIGRDVGRSNSVITRNLKLHNDTNSFNSTKKTGHPRVDRIIQRLSMGDRCHTAAEIPRQIISNLAKDMSRHAVSRRLSQDGLKARSPAIQILISKIYKVARFIFAEEHVMWMDDN